MADGVTDIVRSATDINGPIRGFLRGDELQRYNSRSLGGCSSVVRAPDCGSGGRGFNSRLPPHLRTPINLLIDVGQRHFPNLLHNSVVIHDPKRKYRPFPPVSLPDRQWPNKTIESAPIWCSVDLRDGNQALVEPMNLGEKLELFALLVEVGFKQIEVAFPSASETEFGFVRALIERNLIPDDVAIQVLTPARDPLIRRSIEAVKGAKNVIIHLYNSTSTVQRRVVFGLDQEGILDLAVTGTALIKELTSQLEGTQVRFEYSPESFTGTELDFAARISNAVTNVWEPTVENPIILNLPSTVELATPNVYADQIEWMIRNLEHRDKTLVSLHTHNDRGCAVAAAELGVMAGADRVEGTLFGYGERTGNVDIVTLALNLYSQGVDPKLDFSQLNHVMSIVQKCTDNPIHIRHPYVGELVFTAFSGSHQDAINKGMRSRQDSGTEIWDVPYLPIDPTDIGRSYEEIIRVNSQSGKGGIAWVLRKEHGVDLPKPMQSEFAQVIQKIADKTGKEIQSQDIWSAFESEYLQSVTPLELISFSIENDPSQPEAVSFRADMKVNGEERVLEGHGNGPIAAFADALSHAEIGPFEILGFNEHSIGTGATATAAAYAYVRSGDRTRFGAAIDGNVNRAALQALVSGINRVVKSDA